MKQSEDLECSFTVHGMPIRQAGSLQLGLYMTYTEQGPSAIRPSPAKALGLISKVAEHLLFLLTSAHGAKAQQELSNSECQTGCVTS